MRIINILIFLSVALFLIGCKKQNDKISDKNESEKKGGDTIKYSAESRGNKLAGIITNRQKSGPKIFTADKLDNYLAGQFISSAEKGTLLKLNKATGEKMYFDTYNIPASTFKTLYDNQHEDSVGLKFCFVELDQGYGLIDVGSNHSNFLYLIAVPVDTDGKPVGKENKYLVFNLSKAFDLKTSIMKDDEYDRLIKKFTEKNSEIYDSLKSYYSRNNNGNTISIFYSWGDIRDNINKFCDNNKYDNIKFKLAEIIDIKTIKEYIIKNPQLQLDSDKYKFAYSGREKQLTIVGEFFQTNNTAVGRQQISANKNFDMGSLYP